MNSAHFSKDNLSLKAAFMVAIAALLFSSAAYPQVPVGKINAIIEKRMAGNHIPGLSLAVVRDGKIILAKGYGKASLELDVPATEKTNYLVYSITKTFTAVATMMLVEEGRISLDDPISKHLSGLPTAWNPVSVRQLLDHTSGISSFTKHEKPPCAARKDERDYTQADVLDEVACLPLDFGSGERWAYTDTGYYLLGMLIENISGKTYDAFLRERIFAPLGMNDTRHHSNTALIANRANGYSWENGAYRNADWVDPVIEFSNGGLTSTVLDLAKWDASLYTEELLKRTTLALMWTNATLNSGETVPSYGLGFGLTPFHGRKRVGHSGGGPGFATAITRFLDEKTTVIVLTNADQEGFVIGDMANEIAALYFSEEN